MVTAANWSPTEDFEEIAFSHVCQSVCLLTGGGPRHTGPQPCLPLHRTPPLKHPNTGPNLWPHPLAQLYRAPTQSPCIEPAPSMFKLVHLGPHGTWNQYSQTCTNFFIVQRPFPYPGHVQTCSLGSTDGWQPTGMLSCYFFHSLDWFIKADHLFHYVEHNNLFTYDAYIKKQTKLSRISFLCSFSFSLSSYFSPQFSQSLHFIFEVHMLVPVISIMHFSRRLKFWVR